jgi:hypothetical protein
LVRKIRKFVGAGGNFHDIFARFTGMRPCVFELNVQIINVPEVWCLYIIVLILSGHVVVRDDANGGNFGGFLTLESNYVTLQDPGQCFGAGRD